MTKVSASLVIKTYQQTKVRLVKFLVKVIAIDIDRIHILS